MPRPFLSIFLNERRAKLMERAVPIRCIGDTAGKLRAFMKGRTPMKLKPLHDWVLIRTVEPSPDCGLWITTSNGGDKDSIPDNSTTGILKITVGRPVQ